MADLSMLELPLGELPQSMVDRLLAILSDKLGEPVSMDPHSVELGSVACGSSMEAVLRVLSRRVAPSIRTPGVLRAPTGGILGEHAGMPTWVLGQPIPLEAQNLTLEAVTNAVVGSADGRSHVLMAASQNEWTGREWIADEAIWLVPFQGAEPTSVRLRFPRVPHMDETLVQAMGGAEGDGVPAHWVRLVEGRGHFRLAPPQGAALGPGWRGFRMVHGQPLVVYDESGEKLLGTARIFRKVQET